MLQIKILTIFTITIVMSLISADAATITCAYQGLPPKYSCAAQTTEPITSENQAITVVGTHAAGATNSDVYSIYFNDGTDVLNYIPTKIFVTFPHLYKIVIVNSQVTKMTSNAFIYCDNLNMIDIQNNSFLNLPASFAESCMKLVTLDLSYNGIQTIDSNALKGLTSLRFLRMVYNQIFYIEPSTFQNTPILEELNLSKNLITQISPDTFKGLTNLLAIFINSNNVKILHMLNLGGSSNLHLFSIMDNLIEGIDPLFTSDYPGTRTAAWALSLQGNICTQGYYYAPDNPIPTGALDNCYANYKQIMSTTTTEIPTTTTTTTEVPTTTTIIEVPTTTSTTIVPTTTTIIEVPTTTSTTKIPLTTTTTKIPLTTTTTEVPTTPTVALNSGTCNTKTNCRYFLDQHKNYACVLEDVQYSLLEIGGDHASGMTDDDVKFLFFINSRLSIVPRAIFDRFRNLEYLSVESTHLNIINDETFEVCGSKLKKLDVSHNQIYRIAETSLQKCISLEWLDMTGNLVEEFDGELFHADSKLMRIVMNHIE